MFGANHLNCCLGMLEKLHKYVRRVAGLFLLLPLNPWLIIEIWLFLVKFLGIFLKVILFLHLPDSCR